MSAPELPPACGAPCDYLSHSRGCWGDLRLYTGGEAILALAYAMERVHRNANSLRGAAKTVGGPGTVNVRRPTTSQINVH